MTEQGTPEWLAERCGKITASRIADVMATLKSGQPAASRVNYCAELVAERLTGVPTESFDTPAMRWGRECEPLARSAYEAYTGQLVQQVGLITHPTITRSGASPDGLIGSDGLIEIKCPQIDTHVQIKIKQDIPQRYVYQMLWQMECTGRQWCDFMSFNPRLPHRHQMFVKRLHRDDDALATLRKAVAEFDAEVDALIAKLEATETTGVIHA